MKILSLHPRTMCTCHRTNPSLPVNMACTCLSCSLSPILTRLSALHSSACLVSHLKPIDQRGSEFIDGVALEEYADEQDDYAQEREIEACIKAVDVDCDGKIGVCVSCVMV